MNILVQSISSPIADLFTTYCDYLRANYARRSKLKSRLFNNVISFYTSTSISGPSLTLPGPVSPQASSPSFSQSSSSPLVVLHEHRSNVLSRVYVPIAIIPSTVREQIAGIIKDAVANYSDIVFSILFTIVDEDADELDELGEQFEIVNRRNTTRSSCTSGQSMTMSGSEDEFLDAVEGMSLSGGGNSGGGGGGGGGAAPAAEGEESTQPTIKLKTLKLVTVGNHNAKLRISPLDIQLIYALIKASHSQLAISESLWIALCLSRIDPNRFLYAHISYLTEKYCLVLLDLDHEDFSQCRQVTGFVLFSDKNQMTNNNCFILFTGQRDHPDKVDVHSPDRATEGDSLGDQRAGPAPPAVHLPPDAEALHHVAGEHPDGVLPAELLPD